MNPIACSVEVSGTKIEDTDVISLLSLIPSYTTSNPTFQKIRSTSDPFDSHSPMGWVLEYEPHCASVGLRDLYSVLNCEGECYTV